MTRCNETAACAPKGDALYARAEKSLASGNVRAAVIDLQNLVKDEPDNVKARTLLAMAFVQGGNVPAASIEVQKAKDLGGSPSDYDVANARIHVIDGVLR